MFLNWLKKSVQGEAFSSCVSSFGPYDLDAAGLLRRETPQRIYLKILKNGVNIHRMPRLRSHAILLSLPGTENGCVYCVGGREPTEHVHSSGSSHNSLSSIRAW